MKKPNLQSPLDRLEDEKQHAIFELLKKQHYEDVVRVVRQEHGVRTSVSALQRFFKRRGLQESLRDSLAAQMAFENDADVQTLEKRTRAAVVAAMWEAITTKDVDSISKLGRLLIGIDSGARDAQSLALAREKFEAAERRLHAASDAVNDTKLSDAEKMRRMKEIFG